jgi:hypothetical protein
MCMQPASKWLSSSLDCIALHIVVVCGLQVSRTDSAGALQGELFAFGWHGLRGRAYDGMVLRWKEIK